MGFLVVVQVHELIYVLGYGIVYLMRTQFHESNGGEDFVTIGIANNMTSGLIKREIRVTHRLD